jgi:hypothetical protein
MSVRSHYQKISGIVLLLGVCTASAIAQARDIPAHGPAIVLFDGKDLSQFDTFLTSAGLNSDPNHVFAVENGVVHVSGTEFGYFITKQEYKNYYLRAEFNGAREPSLRARARRATAAFSTTFRGPIKFGRVPSSFRSTKAALAISG